MVSKGACKSWSKWRIEIVVSSVRGTAVSVQCMLSHSAHLRHLGLLTLACSLYLSRTLTLFFFIFEKYRVRICWHWMVICDSLSNIKFNQYMSSNLTRYLQRGPFLCNTVRWRYLRPTTGSNSHSIKQRSHCGRNVQIASVTRSLRTYRAHDGRSENATFRQIICSLWIRINLSWHGY